MRKLIMYWTHIWLDFFPFSIFFSDDDDDNDDEKKNEIKGNPSMAQSQYHVTF